MEIISKEIKNKIWDKIYNEYKFHPSTIDDGIDWIFILIGHLQMLTPQ